MIILSSDGVLDWLLCLPISLFIIHLISFNECLLVVNSLYLSVFTLPFISKDSLAQLGF